MGERKSKMKNEKFITTVLLLSCLIMPVQAFDYVPKSKDKNPFEQNTIKTQQDLKTVKTGINQEKREITNLTEYFKYLPAEVHRNWTPYKSNLPYEVTVQFHINRDGSINDVKIPNSTNKDAEQSVINAVNSGAPYQPLPASYLNKDGVSAQIILEYKPN